MQHQQPKRARSSSPPAASSKRARDTDSPAAMQSQSAPKGPPLPLSLSRLPLVMLTSISDCLDLHSAACMAACSTGMQKAVLQSSAFKGAQQWRANPPPIDAHPELGVWKSDAGLRLLGRREVTMRDLSLIYPVEQAHASSAAAAAAPAPDAGRIALLRHLTELTAQGRRVLQLFESKALTFDRFVGRTGAELRDLLHPEVEKVVIDRWLSEDNLFKLHETRDSFWESQESRPHRQHTLLQRFVAPWEGKYPPSEAEIAAAAARTDGELTRFAGLFEPFTDECIRGIVVGRSVVPCRYVEAELLQDGLERPLYCKWVAHRDARGRYRFAKNKLLDAIRSCPVEGDVCPCCDKRVALFRSVVARLPLLHPPTDEELANVCQRRRGQSSII
jgi:hypothetical protein